MPFLAQEHFPLSNEDILSWTFDHVKYDWDEPIYIDALKPERSVSARQAKKLVRQLAAGFRALGLKKGDCVSIHSFNDIYYPIFFLGVLAAGGVYAGTNPAYTQYELAHTTKIAHVKYILVQPELYKHVLKAAEENGIPKKNIIIFNPNGEAAPPGFLQWQDLLKHGEADWENFDDYQTAYERGAARLYSSGTTGLPKAAELSHLNLTSQHTLVYESYPRTYAVRRCLALPMFHAATAPNAFCTPLRMGNKAYVLPRFDLETWFWCHEKYEITDLAAVPPIVVMAINSPLKEKYSLKAAKVGNIGAAPLDKAPQARMQTLLAEGAPFTQVWGMTETSCIATRHPFPNDDETGSVGFPIPNLDIKLVDDDGKDITAYNVRGEICIRGPTVIKGYYENPEANARDWDSEGFFHTGDIAWIDPETGKYYIVDRKKELIKVRGFQVAPPELEGVLLSHPEIVDAAVIGVPDSRGYELPRGYIVRRDVKSNKPTADEVQTMMKEKLTDYKKLAGGVVFVEAIPKNASGKILKRILRDQAEAEMKMEGKAKL
ncbi:Phenylacetyl-CoA ligase epaB [Fulvia fulva]|uniref:Phenylacetyl-CoA ligase epaB n=1 Tax=Passalora fulva TaxID=5499 RepID=A0A9Q8P8W3_PASFU|nr:Phenylacetyl-CoA ligase epaB [Fulvia fulva]KAK4624064.1 Phenylacetyl-CoA ligase epaB [Fulvia fulva]KAK4625903.1 Phenylacetyl-CoA ligase epaB [Fulvia fulva]UJO17533.1 Phenylacetyl-CoA ligase epaB [Fulvia fulva]WPV15052.1 Phenylacetyl-CoA ligase epaB [Fulvia fulva]WPV30343.1 Phenylacetyl-CoA ligase epaB [Fulvia fulva]